MNGYRKHGPNDAISAKIRAAIAETRDDFGCETCGGDGQTGMAQDGQPIVCRTCGGSGERVCRMCGTPLDQHDPWAFYCNDLCRIWHRND